MNDKASDTVRLDVWLDIACLFKTRSEAKRACEGGKVDVNGDGAKPHRSIREGDRIRIGRGYGRYQDVIVRIAIDQHVKKAEARALYDDVTPRPTAEEIEARRVERVYRAPPRPPACRIADAVGKFAASRKVLDRVSRSWAPLVDQGGAPHAIAGGATSLNMSGRPGGTGMTERSPWT